MQRLVEVTDIWDFSGFTDINKNPYNFYDNAHYGYDVANEEIKYVFGKSDMKQNFGCLLTKENVVEYLVNRKIDYEKCLKEYEENGTIKYNDYNDVSNITIVE